MDDGQAEQQRPTLKWKCGKSVYLASRIPWHIWEGLCVRCFLLTATSSLSTGRWCLWHQLNPNITKQKLKSFNGILDLLMNSQDSSSCY